MSENVDGFKIFLDLLNAKMLGKKLNIEFNGECIKSNYVFYNDESFIDYRIFESNDVEISANFRDKDGTIRLSLDRKKIKRVLLHLSDKEADEIITVSKKDMIDDNFNLLIPKELKKITFTFEDSEITVYIVSIKAKSGVKVRRLR